MKKTYETPVLTTEQFDVEDVITASSPNGTLDTVGGGIGGNETSMIPIGDLINAPGTD